MANKIGRVDTERSKIDVALATDDLTPKQRFALLIAKGTIKWFVSFTKEGNPCPSPTESIIPDFFKLTNDIQINDTKNADDDE